VAVITECGNYPAERWCLEAVWRHLFDTLLCFLAVVSRATHFSINVKT